MNATPSSSCKVKICGLTNLADARAAYAAGADLLGFIFYPKSPRYVAPEIVREIVQHIRADVHVHGSSVQLVGVFVNATAAEIESVLAQADLDLAQLHGDEPPQMVDALHGIAYKALRPATNQAAQAQAALYARQTEIGTSVGGPCWMLDAYDPGEYGGTGKKADWTVASSLANVYPGLLLAGGLTAENVAQAIEIVQPWGVDVASGVESAPGQKDHERVRQFVQAAKQSRPLS